MKRLVVLLLACLCAVPLLAASPAKTVTLTDYVGVAWYGNMVTNRHSFSAWVAGLLKNSISTQVSV
ncbi:MAG: hypothetical protein ACYDBB_17305 [Armatimonadota bacterium]